MTNRLALCFLPTILAYIVAAQEAVPPVVVPEETMQKLLIHKVHPIPTADVRLEGSVGLKAVIDKDGSVQNLQMVSGHPMLVAAAIGAVKQWKYRPYDVNGIPVRVETTVSVNFSCDADRSATTERSLHAAETPVRVASDMLQGLILRRVFPVYPPLARQARIQGMVVLRIIIDKLGNVRDVQLLSGHPMLAPAAIEAVRQWKYYPFELNGEAAEIDADVRVSFKLKAD